MRDGYVKTMLRNKILTNDENLKIIQRGIIIKDSKTPKIRTLSNYDSDRLIKGNFRLIYKVVKRREKNGINEDDSLSIAMLALIEAAERFDFSRGTKFITYAYKHVDMRVYRECNNEKNLIYIPYSICEKSIGRNKEFIKENKYSNNLKNALSISSIDFEAVKNNEIFKSSDIKCKKNLIENKSLKDHPIFLGLTEQEYEFEKKHLLGNIYNFVNDNFSEVEKKVFYYRINDGMKMHDIANIIGKTCQRVSQYEKKILDSLKDYFNPDTNLEEGFAVN
jgi:RNA polymerase nonessential primary-like sigma factor